MALACPGTLQGGARPASAFAPASLRYALGCARRAAGVRVECVRLRRARACRFQRIAARPPALGEWLLADYRTRLLRPRLTYRELAPSARRCAAAHSHRRPRA